MIEKYAYSALLNHNDGQTHMNQKGKRIFFEPQRPTSFRSRKKWTSKCISRKKWTSKCIRNFTQHPQYMGSWQNLVIIIDVIIVKNV